MPNNRKGSKTRIPSVEETNAELAKEFAEQSDSLPKKSDSDALNEAMQSSSVPAEKAEKTVSNSSTFGSEGRTLREPKEAFFPDDSPETDQNAKKFLTKFARDSEKKKPKSIPTPG